MENNNSYQWEIDKIKASPCTCTCHEKPPNKIKTDHKVKFSDTRKEVISSPVTESSPETVSEVIIVSSPPLGIWPLKRSASLESRDNPFLPGGELDLETEELLKRATIIRDRFSLDERNLQNKSDNKTKMSSQSQEDGSLQMEAQTVIEESISPKSANASHTTPNNKQKQNGKLEDSKLSPESVKPEVPNDTADGTAVADDAMKNKKKQKKCCVIM